MVWHKNLPALWMNSVLNQLQEASHCFDRLSVLWSLLLFHKNQRVLMGVWEIKTTVIIFFKEILFYLFLRNQQKDLFWAQPPRVLSRTNWFWFDATRSKSSASMRYASPLIKKGFHFLTDRSFLHIQRGFCVALSSFLLWCFFVLMSGLKLLWKTPLLLHGERILQGCGLF